ncbi:PH domain-containing protein [Actinomyces provencensis]|uniref:PH domain-containing protein n=1 Tax=Actinomyces provencensis TaxID=1720198 RepID=UPI00096A67CE|nr:PH domain-containing protein [Actinomyces provencensis]
MIDFTNASYAKLGPWDPRAAQDELADVLGQGEQILLAFKGIRDSVTFTSKRIIALNVQGMTGKKKDYTSLPYKRVQAFSTETAGSFDLDSELDLWFSGLGKVRLEFNRGVDIRGLGRLLADYCL